MHEMTVARTSPDAAYSAIGIDIGGTNTKMALVRPDLSVVDHLSIPTPQDAESFFRAIAGGLEKLSPGPVAKIGVAVPGMISTDRRSVVRSPNVPFLSEIQLVSELSGRLRRQVVLETDLNAAAIAGLRAAPVSARRLLVASIGTGLGAGVMIDGQPLRFAGGTAGDNGHIILDGRSRFKCSAGCSGCAEALIAAPALERAARSADLTFNGESDAFAVIQASLNENAEALAIVLSVGDWLGQWLASLLPIFQPDYVVLAGGISEAGEPLLRACRERFSELAEPFYAERCTIVLSGLGVKAAVVGAASMVL